MLLLLFQIACSYNQHFTSFLSHVPNFLRFLFCDVYEAFFYMYYKDTYIRMCIHVHLSALFILCRNSPWMPLSVAFPVSHDTTEGKHSFSMVRNPVFLARYLRNPSVKKNSRLRLRLLRPKHKIYMGIDSMNLLTYNTLSILSSGISMVFLSQLFFLVDFSIFQDNHRWKSISILV